MMRVHKNFTFATPSGRMAIFFLILLTSLKVFASEGIWVKELQDILDKNGLAKDQYGIEIRNIAGDKTYFSANKKKAFNPASTMKLLISVAALEKFGPQYKFQTSIKKQGDDVCLVGGGDPSFVYEDMFLMVEELLRSPSLSKKTINNIIVDESFFPTTRQYNGDFEDDAQRSFTAPLSSLSLNYNSVTIFVKPSSNGEKPFIYTEPRSSYFSIQNIAKTVKVGKTIGINVDAKPEKIDITVTGTIGENEKELIIYRAVTEPSIYAGYIFKDMLSRAGVTVSGAVQKKSCAGAVDVVTFKSKPLSHVIGGMNKFSNNFIAETLLYHLGDQPTSESGLNKMLTYVKEKNLPMENVKIQNASGLSRDNALTPDFLWSLFSYGRNSFQTYPELMASLPIGGLDGTLKRRFHQAGMESNVRAKSGSLKNTVSLVGSVNTVKKGELLFVFLFETRAKTGAQIQYIEEKLLEKVAALGKN